MRLFSRIFNRQPQAEVVRPKRKRAVKVEQKSSGNYSKLFERGLDVSGDDMLPYKTNASVYKAVKAIADNATQAKIAFYDKKTGEEITEGKDFDNLTVLFNKPNARQSGCDLLGEWFGYFALYGEGFIQKITSTGQATGKGINLPAGLRVLDPDKMKEQVDQRTGDLLAWAYGGKYKFTAEELVHTKEFNPYNQYRGLSPLDPIKDEMEIDLASLTFNNSFFKNDATPHFILSTDKTLSDDQKKRLLEWWNAQHKGDKKAFKTAVFEGGLKPSTIATTHKEMDFIEQKKLMREEIIGNWRAPKALFNITENLNYATFIGQMKIFWIYTLMPIMRKFEDSVNRHLIEPYNPNIIFMFDVKNVPAFQDDFGAKVITATQLFAMGFTRNEINEKLEFGFEDAKWGDDWWVGFGLTPASQTMDNPVSEGIDPNKPNTTDSGENGDNTQDDEKVPENGLNGENKGIEKPSAKTVKQLAVLKAFGQRQSALEEKMHSKIKRYFFDLRKQILATPDNLLKAGKVEVDWGKQNEQLQKFMTPLIEVGIKEGVDIGKEIIGRKKDFAEQDFNNRLSSLLTIRANKILGINDTLKNNIQKTLEQAIKDGSSVTAMQEGIILDVMALRDVVRNKFNSYASRALMIARTESAGAVNEGSAFYYKEEGVEMKEWITAHDENVRDSHRACEMQGAIKMKDAFINGLDYPSEQGGEAGEVINCRCTLSPVFANA